MADSLGGLSKPNELDNICYLYTDQEIDNNHEWRYIQLGRYTACLNVWVIM